MRTFHPMPEGHGQDGQSVRPTLRTDHPAANYARRSNPYAKNKQTDKSQSREMLTEDLMEWAIGQGWKEEALAPYFADLGLSGTLRPDQRPDLLRLFENIDKGVYDHGSVICFQENRLFRDETQIYYNQFIDKCKQHDIVVVVVSPYLMIYDFRDDFLTEMFRWKCKEAADFIKRHIKGWMLPARQRAAWIDGEWAGLGDPPPGFIVDFDEKSLTYKKLIPYAPHIEKTIELYELFRELCGDISLLYRRVRESPVIFPEFEPWVDPRNVKRFKMTKHPGGGYYPKGKSTIVSMLTNPIYIGYRSVEGVVRRNRQGEKIIEHEPVINRELFDFAFYRLAKTDLERKLIQAKKTLEEEAVNDLGTLDKELEKLEEQWPDHTFEKRRSLMNFLVREVIVDTASTHWIRVQVVWLHEEWGREEMYYYRRRGVNKAWTEQEVAVVREHYAATPKFELMALLPQRGWQAIRSVGDTRLEIARRQGRLTTSEQMMTGLDVCASFSDMEFIQRKGILPRMRSTNWERLS